MTFQLRVRSWMFACFGSLIPYDKVERNHRFLEEALELVQAAGCTKREALKLVDYVYDRPVGEMHQEIGGVMVTLAALADAHGADMEICADVELRRCWDKIEQIRAKQAAKPKMSVEPAMFSAPLQDPKHIGVNVRPDGAIGISLREESVHKDHWPAITRECAQELVDSLASAGVYQ